MSDIPVESPSLWTFVLFDPYLGLEWALEGWQSVSITENFEYASITISIPGYREELNYVVELITDLLVYDRDNELVWRCRVMDVNDSFTTDAHVTTIICQSYEAVLARRVLFEEFDIAADQHEMAWMLVDYTQQFEDLGIEKSADWAPSGVVQDRIIQAGRSIADSINEPASSNVGFDWWVDEDLKLHTQTPRREYEANLHLSWGANVVSVERASIAAEYNSVVMAIGATSETVLPSGTYPPPPPAIRQLTSRPLGRWESVFSYGDIVTEDSVIAKAEWHLAQSTAMRRVYNVGLQYGVWTRAIRPGAIVELRVESLPRVSFKVKVRVEELSVEIGASGEESVTLGLRGEENEINIRAGGYEHGVGAQLADPPGAVDVALTTPSGLSKTKAVISGLARLVGTLVDLRERVSRTERSS